MKNIFLLILLFVIACNQTDPIETDVVTEIKTQRIQKDITFKTSPHSPLPEKEKEDFEGLPYFPVDLDYRYQVELKEYANPDTFKMMTSVGMQRDAIRYGWFDFFMHDMPCTLQVYKILDVKAKYPDYLFVPFTDMTSGEQSYPGGRYIDLKEKRSQTYTLDFNLAYNPSCAYGRDGYNCPIPPAENRLDVAVLAGEKKYSK